MWRSSPRSERRLECFGSITGARSRTQQWKLYCRAILSRDYEAISHGDKRQSGADKLDAGWDDALYAKGERAWRGGQMRSDNGNIRKALSNRLATTWVRVKLYFKIKWKTNLKHLLRFETKWSTYFSKEKNKKMDDRGFKCFLLIYTKA